LEIASNPEEPVAQSVELAQGVRKVIRREKQLEEIKSEIPRPTSIKALRGEVNPVAEENRPTHTISGSSGSLKMGRRRKDR